MKRYLAVAAGLWLGGIAADAAAQQHGHPEPEETQTIRAEAPDSAHHEHGHAGPEAGSAPSTGGPAEPARHGMWMLPIGGWTAGGMAQLHPILTTGSPLDDGLPIHDTEAYLTQPALMGVPKLLCHQVPWMP